MQMKGENSEYNRDDFIQLNSLIILTQMTQFKSNFTLSLQPFQITPLVLHLVATYIEFEQCGYPPPYPIF